MLYEATNSYALVVTVFLHLRTEEAILPFIFNEPHLVDAVMGNQAGAGRDVPGLQLQKKRRTKCTPDAQGAMLQD